MSLRFTEKEFYFLMNYSLCTYLTSKYIFLSEKITSFVQKILLYNLEDVIKKRSIIGNVEHVTEATKAVVALHNFLMDDRKMYCPHNFGDHVINGILREGIWRNEDNFQGEFCDIRRVSSNNFTLEAKEVRDNFCEYFMTDAGFVSWQQNVVNSTLDIFHMES